MVLNRNLKTTFSRVSELYNYSRPDYPQKLIDDIIKISKINNKSKILDIGCGSGQATFDFEKSAHCHIFGLDISNELIDIAKKKNTLKNINFVVGSFETYNFKDKFNLIISAQAFHWLDPNIVYNKTYNLLNKSGYVAIFWNFQIYNKGYLKKLDLLFRKNSLNYDRKFSSRKKVLNRLRTSGLFTSIKIKDYTRYLEYSKEKYIQLLNSFSWMNSLEHNKKYKILCEVKKILSKESEPLNISFKTYLVIAKVKY